MSQGFLKEQEVEAILLMFGKDWQHRYKSLDGKEGRPSITDCISFALRKENSKAKEDLVDFLEDYLEDMSKRCTFSYEKDG